MPELPEVETIKRGLSCFLIGAKITKIDVKCPKSFIGTQITSKVNSIRRFGKALVIDLSDKNSLMIHLRMTGQLIFDPKSPNTTSNRFAAGHPSDNFIASLPNNQTRVVIYFDNGILYFNDQRKFGFIKVLKTTEVENDSFIKKLAKEPWNISPDEFYQNLQKHRNSSIKATILDQSVICGLGNIYADESLFAAKIHPATKTGRIARSQSDLLLQAAANVMEKSITSGGSTMATYVKPDSTKGDYLEKFAQVFRKEGAPCPRCQTTILKTKVAGRGTHFCPQCQKEQND